MAFQDFLLRARRPASLVAFNGALPANFKLIHKPDATWLTLPGVNIDIIEELALEAVVVDGNGNVVTPAVISSASHYNVRVVGDLGVGNEHHEWSGWDGLFIQPGDPDFDDGGGGGDTRLDNSKVKQWFKNNGVERLDDASEHPRSGRANMRWFRWMAGAEHMDVTIDAPMLRRRKWL